MTLIVFLSLFVLLAVAGPLFGADSRVSGGWSTNSDDRLWTPRAY